MAAQLPRGWPKGVHPPGTERFEDTAVAWLLDVVPPDYRLYGVLRRYPAALAQMARHHCAPAPRAPGRGTVPRAPNWRTRCRHMPAAPCSPPTPPRGAGSRPPHAASSSSSEPCGSGRGHPGGSSPGAARRDHGGSPPGAARGDHGPRIAAPRGSEARARTLAVKAARPAPAPPARLSTGFWQALTARASRSGPCRPLVAAARNRARLA